MSAKHAGIGIYLVKRTRGMLWWRSEVYSEAYWYAEPSTGQGSWHWVEDDHKIDDPDTRIALNEAHLRYQIGAAK